MTSNIFHDAPKWHVTRRHETQNEGLAPSMMSSKELSHHPFMAENFPLIMNGDFDPWVRERFGWNSETVPMPEQYLANCAYPHADSVNSLLQLDGSGSEHPMSQQASEKALFMTPSAYQLSFSALPGSSISDLCSSLDVSHAASSIWEADQERDSVRSPLSSENEIYMQALSEVSGMASGYISGEDEDGYPTTLEMPDGSTRRTSNWLPVDPQAGFTVGSHSQKRDYHTKFMHLEHVEDIQEAFISPNIAGWQYDGWK